MTELVIIIIYFLGMLTIGIVSRKKTREVDDFFVAGRQSSSLFVTGSLLATIIGGSATVGMAGLGFSRGLTGAWWLLVGSIGLVFLGLFFAKKVSNKNYSYYSAVQSHSSFPKSKDFQRIFEIISWTPD